MTAPQRLREYLAAKYPGRRCPACGWDEPTQGHSPECQRGVAAGRQAMRATADAHPADVDAVDRVLVAFIRKGVDFSGNDLRPYLTHVANRNVIGSRIQTFARRGRIRDTGTRVKSSDPGTHAHEIRVWRPVA